MGRRPVLRTLSRATAVLDLFTADAPEWGPTAVSHELRIAKSQAHELLVSLATGGLLQRVGAGRYRLGWRIAALNSVLVETSGLLRLVAPRMRGLGAPYGETGHRPGWGGGAGCVGARPGGGPTAVPPL